MILSEVKGMNQYLFEDWLRNRLADLPAEELDRIVAFYLDAVDERVEEGMTEEEAIHDLGEPESLLAGIRASLPEYVTYAPVRQKTMRRRTWLMALVILAVGMVALPLLILLFNFTGSVAHEIAVPSETPMVDAPIVVEDSEVLDFSSSYSFDASDLEKVTVPAAFGSVQVEPSEDGSVQIIGDGSLFEAVRRGSTLYIENVESDLILRIPDHLKLDIKCDAGDVVLYEIAPQSLSVYCDLGSITLYGVSAANAITLETDLGSIAGSLRGAKADYEIDVQADLGQTNLSDTFHSGDAGIKLTVTTDIGSIEIDFEE